MADIERQMISKIIEDQDISTAVLKGVRRTWFDDDDSKRAFQWILEHKRRHGKTPSDRTFRGEFPNYRLAPTDEPYDYYVDALGEQQRRIIILDTQSDMDDLLKEGDTKGAEKRLSQGLLQLSKVVTDLTDTDLSRNSRRRLLRYKNANEHRGEVTGIHTGFDKFDLVSGGYHPEQFVIFGGQPKQCKSFMLLLSAMAARAHGHKVLFLTFEMSAQEIEARYDGIASGVCASKIFRDNIDDEEYKKLKQGIALHKNLAPFKIVADVSATTTASAIAGKIDQYRPDIVFIDGCYLMDNEAGHQAQTTPAFTAISRSLKRLAQRTKIPVVGTTQALPGKVDKRTQEITMFSFGWTSAWVQDADVIIGVEKVLDSSNLIRVRGIAGRNFAPFESFMKCTWEESLFEESDFGDEPDPTA